MKKKNIVTNTQNDPIIITCNEGENLCELFLELYLNNIKGKFYVFADEFPGRETKYMIVKADKYGTIKNIHRWTYYRHVYTTTNAGL